MMKTITETARYCGQNATVALVYLLSFYTNGQQLHGSLTESWDHGWKKYTQSVYNYNASGHLSNSLQQQWDASTVNWQDGFRTVYTNNATGNPNVILVQIWDLTTNNWVNSQRVILTYNNDEILTKSSELFVAGNWQNLSRETNSYDLSGYLVNNLYEIWDSINNVWKPSTLTEYSNNPNGKPAKELVKVWAPPSNQWEYSELHTYIYNTSDKVVAMLLYTMQNGKWVRFSQDIFSYDSNNYLTEMISRNWENAANNWENDVKYTYSNGIDGTLRKTVNQFWNGKDWSNDLRFTFVYEPVGILETDKSKVITIAPNPASDTITINNRDIEGEIAYEITDQTGRNFLNGLLKDDESKIDIHSLATGIYFIRFGHQKQQTVRMMKK
jgi:hypothetical protein